MLGTVAWAALCVLAATPDGTTIDIGHESGVMPATFQEQAPPVSERPVADAPAPPPKPLPPDPAYEANPATGEEGIPGLPPEAAQPPKEMPKRKTATPPSTVPSRPPKPLRQVPLPAFTQPQPFAPAGEATATGQACAPLTGQDSCNPCNSPACGSYYLRDRLNCCLDGIAWEGWLDQGATLNTLSPRDRINGPVTFNNRSNDYQLNQLYGRLKRDVDTESDCWDLGGRIDFLYGTDSIYTEARGLETFDDFSPKWNAQQLGAALPQCYMEAYCPWGDGLDMKLGHYYAPHRL